MASAQPSRQSGCIGADDFVAMLRHLGEASGTLGRGSKGRQAQAAKGATETASPGAGVIRQLLARLECAAKGVQDVLGSASVLACLLVLRLTERLVLLNYAWPCRRCSFGRGKKGVQVDRLTSVHWALSNMLVQLQGQRLERTERNRAVREFVSRHRTSSLLTIRIRRHVDCSLPQQIRDFNAKTLRQQSSQLLVDLLEEMRIPVFSTHPFFMNLRTNHPQLVRELSQEALHPVLKMPDEVVFCVGDICSRMYTVVNGQVQYCANVQQRDAPATVPPSTVRRTLHGGHWISEAALWTGWVHRGELRAVSDCLLFALDAAGFARVISSHKLAHAFAASYARKFVESLNRVLQTDLVEAGPVDQ